MKRMLAALGMAAAMVAGTVALSSAAEAKQPPARCHTFSVITSHETRDVTGWNLGYIHAGGVYERVGNGVQERTTKTTTQRCRGKRVVTVTTTPWTYLPGQGPDLLVPVGSNDSGGLDEHPWP